MSPHETINCTLVHTSKVEPKYGQRLIKLMEGGNQYIAAIVSSAEEGVTVIIREVHQDPSQVGRLSFPQKGSENFRAYVGDRIIRRELEYEEALPEKPSYTVIGGEETELLTEDSPDTDDENDDEE